MRRRTATPGVAMCCRRTPSVGRTALQPGAQLCRSSRLGWRVARARCAARAAERARAGQGVLRMGQEVEVRPGIIQKDAEGRVACTPIYSRIVSLFAEQNPLQFAVPGGLIGVGTTARAQAAWATGVG